MKRRPKGTGVTSKSARTKLRLGKQTLKDLTAPVPEKVRAGAMATAIRRDGICQVKDPS